MRHAINKSHVDYDCGDDGYHDEKTGEPRAELSGNY